uniref:Integrase catalytic domain-containing protein n=1 Tax=Hucho hucho TaxID=62062 RepID=A0A4W5NV15_9TELE
RRYHITKEHLKFLIDYLYILFLINVSFCVLFVFSNFLLFRSYSLLSDAQLDERIKELIGQNEEIGAESVRAHLRGEGVGVQRERVRQSLIRVDPQGAARRAMQQQLRRQYRVAGPNSLWHIDGTHKLIRIVIHGAVDGYSRPVVFLKASDDNNRSATVMESFEAAITSYGVPSRVRCDRGGENNCICVFMEQFRGGERGSAFRGRSTHNQRIERLWRDVWHEVSNVYHDLFTFLETEQIIDINNEVHLWALHFVFLSRVNRDLAAFASQWNHHGLRTEQRQSPLQLFVSGSLVMQKPPPLKPPP